MLLFYLHIYLPESLVKYRILGWKSSAYWKHCIVVFYYSVFVVEKFKAIVFHCMWLDCSFLEACTIFCVTSVMMFHKKFLVMCLFSLIFVGARNSCPFYSSKSFVVDFLPQFSLSSLSWIHYSDVASIWPVP